MKADVRAIKEKYPKGTKLRLIKMLDDHAPEPGTVATVGFVDDAGQIHADEFSLAIIPGVDEFEVIA